MPSSLSRKGMRVAKQEVRFNPTQFTIERFFKASYGGKLRLDDGFSRKKPRLWLTLRRSKQGRRIRRCKDCSQEFCNGDSLTIVGIPS